MPFTQAPLPYAYDALEPYIDARTMEIHYSKHHAAYISNLNAALEHNKDLQGKSIEALLADLNAVPAEIRTAVQNNGGGHANHTMFWETIGPKAGGAPNGPVAEAINKAFGSFDDFKKKFSEASMKRFGSGWAWLVAEKDGSVVVTSTANQDTPLMESKSPILGLDVWEHAYYLLYQNRRADYVSAFWNVVNWEKVNELYGKAKG